MHARKRGGAIYVLDTDYTMYNFLPLQHKERKFYKTSLALTKEDNQLRFHFYNNTVGKAGSAVYGDIVSESDIFYFEIHSVPVNDTSVVSSFRVCICIYSKPNCSIANLMAKVLLYKIEITAIGQRNGTDPSPIRAKFIQSSQAQLIKRSIGNQLVKPAQT